MDFRWWRNQLETFSALLALCAGNLPVTGEFPSQRPVTLSFDVFFDLRLNKRLSKQSRPRWFEAPSRSLWRHCNEDDCCNHGWEIIFESHFGGMCTLTRTHWRLPSVWWQTQGHWGGMETRPDHVFYLYIYAKFGYIWILTVGIVAFYHHTHIHKCLWDLTILRDDKNTKRTYSDWKIRPSVDSLNEQIWQPSIAKITSVLAYWLYLEVNYKRFCIR